MRKLRKSMAFIVAMLMLVSMFSTASATVLNEPIEDAGVIKLVKSIRPLGTIASAMNGTP